MHNIIFTRSTAALAAVAFLGIAGCETTTSPQVDCASNPGLCAIAADAARDINSQAGLEISDQISLSGASAEGATITVTYEVIYPKDRLGGQARRALQSIAYDSLVYNFCRPETQLFLDQGGKVRLVSYSSDGLLVTSTAVDGCPAQSFARE